MSTTATTEIKLSLDPYGAFPHAPLEEPSPSLDQLAELAKCRQSLIEAHEAFLLSKDDKDYQEIIRLSEEIQSLWRITHPLNANATVKISEIKATVLSAKEDALDETKVKTIKHRHSQIALISDYAIFKQNPSAFFEEFCFRASIMTYDSRYFVPTKYLSDLSFHPSVENDFSKIDDKILGSLQPFLHHPTLRSLLEKKDENDAQVDPNSGLPKKDQDNKEWLNDFENLAAIVRIVLADGMRDCNPENVLISPIIWFLFDNGESWSQSADLITNKSSWHLPACRCCFFQLPLMYQSLDTKYFGEESQREILRKAIRRSLSNEEELGDFLMCQDYKFNLPPEVFNHKDTLEAWRERMNRMLKAIDDPKVVNLRDFFFAVQPIIKFLALLNIAYAMRFSRYIRDLTDPIEIQMASLERSLVWDNNNKEISILGVGASPLEIELSDAKLSHLKINPRTIWEMTNSDKPFDDLVVEIQNLVKSLVKENNFGGEKSDKIRLAEDKIARDELLSELIAMAKPDYKSLL